MGGGWQENGWELADEFCSWLVSVAVVAQVAATGGELRDELFVSDVVGEWHENEGELADEFCSWHVSVAVVAQVAATG